MKVLVYGAGAIGGHLGYCFHETGHDVTLVSRGRHYEQMKRHGMRITICDNEAVQTEKRITEGARFHVADSLDDLKDLKPDYLFITVKLKDYNAEALSHLVPFMGPDTAVIPPCTKLPFWWFYNLPGEGNAEFRDLDFDNEVSRHFIRENIICMTMWVSAVLETPGHVVVKHVQRGYPLGAVFEKMDPHAARLREVLNRTCVSPEVDDIRSEVFIKSINSFSFNLVAILTGFNNQQLNEDNASRETIHRIMKEGDAILERLGIPIIQSVESRISQTLSSTKHTMSMLHDFNTGRPVELAYLWDGFEGISSTLGIDMPFSRRMFEKTMTKVSARDSGLNT